MDRTIAIGRNATLYKWARTCYAANMAKMNWKKNTVNQKLKETAGELASEHRIYDAARIVFCYRCRKEEAFDANIHIKKTSQNLDENGNPRRYWVCNPKVKKETTDEWRKRLFG